jgi:hypothetical protein
LRLQWFLGWPAPLLPLLLLLLLGCGRLSRAGTLLCCTWRLRIILWAPRLFLLHTAAAWMLASSLPQVVVQLLSGPEHNTNSTAPLGG